MATIRQRINRKNAAGTYDTIHLETSSDLVLRPDGTTLEATIEKVLEDLANKSGVTYSTTNPKVAGTASPGTATTVARSDHIHPAQTTISGNAASATKLATARTIDGVSFNGSAAIHHYGTCSTAAATAAKVVSLTGFSLVTGAVVRVKFTATNTAANPTLNVNSTGAKAIYYRGAAIAAGTLAANRTYEFVYNGAQYELVGDVNTDTNTTYTAATETPKVAGTAAVGTSAKYAREDHVHPAQTTISGNAGSATKLATARTFRVNLASTSTASFNGTANVTPGVTGILPVANGGTGVNNLDALKASLGVSSVKLGSTVSLGGYNWIVVHQDGEISYLALAVINEMCAYGSSTTSTYSGSTLASRATAFQNALPSTALANAVDTTVNSVTKKVFVCSVAQATGDFEYFKTESNRICTYNGVAQTWWTSTPLSGGVRSACTVGESGYADAYGGAGVTQSNGFRPFIAVKL